MASKPTDPTGARHAQRRLVPVRSAVVGYLTAGLLWIVVSGPVADAFTAVTTVPRWIAEVGKGVLFVVVTAAILEVALRRRAVRADSVAAAVKEHARRLISSEERNRLQATALSRTSNAVVITGEDGTIEWVNAAFETISGYPASAAVGATFRLVDSGVHDATFFEDLWETVNAGQVWQGEIVNRRSDGELYTVRQTITPLSAEDGEGQHLVAIQEDITERLKTARELEQLATYDPLTSLPNRVLFTERLERARAGASNTAGGYALLFLDLDGFKTINDSLGHDAGDEVLRMVATRLQGVLRPSDTVARFGGDEFALLCPGLGSQTAADEVARRVQEALATAFETTHRHLTITASIGIVLGDDIAETTALLRDVDAAMYAAKARGRNRIEHFDTGLHELANQRLEVTAQLQDAITDDGVVVRYQPTLDLATGKVVGVEALVRLRTREGGLLAPDAFIGIAEEAGLIGALGHRVLEIACADAAGWLAGDPDFMVAVNLSAHQFTDAHLADSITDTLDAAGIPAANLWLEITESALLTGPHVDTAIQRLRHLGVNFAIDDFGTGYSSLAHLRDTPVDGLKIDRGFVAGLLDSPRDRALIVASIDLAEAFGLVITAEGIETDPQRRELAHLGCHYAQGYLWSAPVAADQITAVLASSSAAVSHDLALGSVEGNGTEVRHATRAVGVARTAARTMSGNGRTARPSVLTGPSPTHTTAPHGEATLHGVDPAVPAGPPGHAEPDAAATVSGVTRQLLHAESAAEVRDILLIAVDQLGGSTVTADTADDDALPVDLTLGADVPLLPTAEPDSVARMHLERYLPGLIADARQTLDVLARTQQLSKDATTDHLTQLGNRATFARLLSRLGPDDLIVAIDLDEFKMVNDTHGHGAGDEVLRAFASCLRGQLRAKDHAIRLGGDEFAIVLTGVDVDGGVALLDRLRTAWSEQRTAAVGFSAGLARGQSSPATTREAADHALYAAKTAGKGRTIVADSNLTDDHPDPEV